MATGIEVLEKLVDEIELAKKNATTYNPYTIGMSNWINRFMSYETTIYEKRSLDKGIARFYIRRGICLTIKSKDGKSILVTKFGVADGRTKKEATEMCFQSIYESLIGDFGSVTQMDAVNVDQYDLIEVDRITSEEVSSRQSNTILTVAAEAAMSGLELGSSAINRNLCSSEKSYPMATGQPSLMDRWLPWHSFEVKTDTDEIFSLNIPEGLYQEDNAINLLPLKGFLYGDLDLEVKIVVNSAPFHAGRIIFGLFYCAQGLQDCIAFPSKIDFDAGNVGTFTYSSTASKIYQINGMLQRPHVICDLSKSTTGTLEVKFLYNKSYVRLLDYSKNNSVNPGVVGANFVTLSGRMLSALRTGDDQPKSIHGTVFYRFTKADLTGMTKTHSLTQMDKCENIDKTSNILLRKGIRVKNSNKPTMVYNNVITTPRPRIHLPNGIGLSDSIVMSIDPRAVTTHYESGNGPESYLELAKIPGITTSFWWSMNSMKKAEIFSQVVQPCIPFENAQPVKDKKILAVANDSLPLHIASNGFMNWGGTIIYMFDIVKTEFHKGTILISINFGKGAQGGVLSTYEKIVDIQETSCVKITVPYIYDTVCRRMPNTPYFRTIPEVAAWNDLNVPNYSNTEITVTVVNPLINIANVNKEVNVLVWKYAGEDFFLNTLCQVNNIALNYKAGSRDFPNDSDLKLDDLTSTTKYKNWSWKGGPAKPFKFTKIDNDSWRDSNGVVWDKDRKFFLDSGNWTPKENYAVLFTQMDFSAGIQDMSRLKSGDETNFKNILRMPIRILASEKIANDKNYFIPVCPITSVLLESLDIPGIGALSFTHHYQIMKMFRLWRGSLRYTIVVRGEKPVWVSYLPASGAIKSGPHNKMNNIRIIDGDKAKVAVPVYYGTSTSLFPDMSASGNYMTMILEKLNPSEVVEIPWNMPENWAFTQQSSMLSQVGFREVAGLVNGHLVIYSDASCEIDVLISVGADFDLGGFCGITDNIPLTQRLTRSDDVRFKNKPTIVPTYTVTQMDFEMDDFSRNGEVIESKTQSLFELEDVKSLVDVSGALLLGSIILPSPFNEVCRFLSIKRIINKVSGATRAIEDSGEGFLGVCDTVKKTIPAIEEAIQSTSENIGNVSTSFSVTCDQVGNILESTDEKIIKPLGECIKPVVSAAGAFTQGSDYIQSVFDYVKDLFPAQFDLLNLGSTVYNVISEMLVSILSCNYGNFMTSFINILSSMGLISNEWIIRKLDSVLEVFQRIVSSRTQSDLSNDDLLEQGQINLLEEDQKTLLGLIFGGILTTWGVYTQGWWQRGYRWFIGDYISLFTIGKGLNTMNSSISFVRNCFGCIKHMLEMVMGYENDEVRIKVMLAGQSGIIDNFIKNAHEFLNAMNDSTITNVKNKSKYWITVCNAYQLQGCIMRLGAHSVGNTLINLCRDVIKKANENSSLFQATAVRYEPIVIVLEGEPGVGKSFLSSKLSVVVLRNLGIKTDTIDIKFNMSPGVKYWNLYNGQPIIIGDDWASLTDTESAVRDCGVLYELKTPNIMNAPKAELSEKKTVVNPFAVILCTNNPFPVCNAVYSQEALYRRRDIIVKCRQKEGATTYENFAHLEFCFHETPLQPSLNGEWLNYEEFEELFTEMHLLYHEEESKNVKTRIKILSECLREEALISDNLQDPFTLQARSLYSMEHKDISSGCPSEYLEAQVAQIVSTIEENFSKVDITGKKITIKGKMNIGRHMYNMKKTEGILDTGYDYFIAPLINSYEALKECLNDWMYHGLRCGTCSSVCSDGWILKRCVGCRKNYCSRCAQVEDGSIRCSDCGNDLELVGLPWLDLLISHVYSVGLDILGISRITTLVCSFVKYFTSYDLILPVTVANFVLSFLRTRSSVEVESHEPLTLEEISNTEMGDDILPDSLTEGSFKRNTHGKNKKNGKSRLLEEREVHKQDSIDIVTDASLHGAEPAPIKPSGLFGLHANAKSKNKTFQKEQVEAQRENEKKYANSLRYLGAKPNLAGCNHVDLFANVNALYFNGSWTHGTKLWQASVCANDKNCPLNSLNDKHLFFIEAHYAENGTFYDKYVQELQNKKMTEEEFENKVPCYYWPEWFVSANFREERDRLSSSNWWDSISDYAPDWIKKICKILAGIGCVYVTFKCCKKFMSLIKDVLYSVFGWDNATQVAFEYDEMGNRKATKRSTRIRKGLSQTNSSVELDSNSNLYYENIVNKIINNFVKIKINNYKEIIGLGLYGSRILVPKHYRGVLEKAESIEVRFANTKHENLKVNLANLRIVEMPDQDAAIVEVSKAICFCDIRKFFITQKEMDDFVDDSITLIIPRKTGELEEIDLTVTGQAEEHNAFDVMSGSYFYSKGVLEYNFQEKGACGSILLRKAGNRPLLGIHIAGTEILNSGVGLVLVRESLTDESSFDFAPLPYILSDDVLDFGSEANVEYLGKIDAKLTPHMPNKSEIVHSVIDEYFEEANEVQPAILSGRDARYLHRESPLVCGVKKHGKPTFDFEEKHVELAADFWEKEFLKFPFEFEHDAKVYNMKEAAVGRPEIVDYYDPLPDNTSAGWPWNVIEKKIDGNIVRASKKKHWMQYIRNEQDQPIDVEFDPLLINVYDKEMEYRKNGILAPVVFQDVLKDEKRKIDKLVKEGGTRVFSMSPISASLAMRAYTLDFTSWIRANRISNWIAVGISCDGPEWTRLANRLLSRSNNIFSIDFSNFGPGLNVSTADRFSKLVNKFNKKYIEGYTAEDEKVMDVMGKELTYSVHLAGGTLYRTKAGSPSGAAVTVEMNSYVHLMYLVVVWLIIKKILEEMCKGVKANMLYLNQYDEFIGEFKHNGLNAKKFLHKMSLDDFKANVIGNVYGDDGIFSVSEDYKDLFNAKTIQLILKVHGIVATDASKQKDIVKYATLDKMTFLKRGFVKHPKSKIFWLAPIEETSIKECARWIHKTFSNKEMTRVNVQSSLLLAYGKGEKWYKAWQDKINEYLNKAKIPAVYITWEELDNMFFPELYGFNEEPLTELKSLYKDIVNFI